ncbi:MAG: hypothetical protein ABWY11_10350, partial [Umezawaea sp.]
PEAMLVLARNRPRQQESPTEFALDDGTRVVCTRSTNSGGLLVPACAWVTAGVFGQVAPLTPVGSTDPQLSTGDLADIVRAMLPDLA